MHSPAAAAAAAAAVTAATQLATADAGDVHFLQPLLLLSRKLL